MSAGGQNSLASSDSSVPAFVGPQSMRLRDTSDVVARIRVQGVYRMFNSSAPTAFRNRAPTGYDSFLQFLEGRKEGCATCAGLPYQPLTTNTTTILSFRN
jgi:hypothetical protein